MRLNVRLAQVWAPAVILACFAGALVTSPPSRARSTIATRPEPPRPQPAHAPTSASAGLYAADPSHLWNRVHRQLFVRVADDGREYGFDEVDPLLWRETKFLLTDSSHSAAIRVLDEFLETDGEKLITDPLRRAVFQHDLWAVFDWAAASREGEPAARTALLIRLARIIRRVALTTEEVAQLPDTYAAAVASGAFAARFDPADPDRAFLPADLLGQGGDWVAIGGNGPVAIQHAHELSRSAFGISWRVPGGAGRTRRYLRRLWDVAMPFVPSDFNTTDEQRVMLNPDLPPIPPGTQLTLVRTLLLIDKSGVVRPSPIVASVQLQTFAPDGKRFAEAVMRRQDLFAGRRGGLTAVRPGDRGFLTFSSKGIDPFERESGRRMGQPAESLRMCRSCHYADEDRRSTDTIMSLPKVLKPNSLVDTRHERWARWFTQGSAAATFKQGRADLGRLQGLWESNPW
jgi:hypothetical protein